jgi:multimeric flavodoxin WrbA
VEFALHGMDIRPCRACEACQKSRDYRCVQADDMTAVYAALRGADGLLVASPVYWFTLSAQSKLFLDRLYAFVGPDGHGLAGKRLGLVLAYGDVDPFSSGAVNALRTFQDAARYLEAPIAGMVYGSAGAPGEVAANAGLLDEAFALGRALAGA